VHKINIINMCRLPNFAYTVTLKVYLLVSIRLHTVLQTSIFNISRVFVVKIFI